MGSINSNDRFVRWQTNLRNQVSFTNNLLLTISIGIAAFFFSLLSKTDFQASQENISILQTGLIILIVSIFIGIITNVSRIIDFKLTLKKIKKELDLNKDIDNLKYWAKTFGKITWFLFYSQIASMLIGLIYLFKAFYKLYL